MPQRTNPLDMNPPEWMDWPLPISAVKMISETERGPNGGVALRAYRCPAGTWTAGLGETDGVGPTTRGTCDYWWQRFADGLRQRADAVAAMCTVQPSGNELSALVSLAYNIGEAALKSSTVMRLHNRSDKAGAARAFALWNKATIAGKLTVLPGLVTRRSWEAALYLTPDSDDAPLRMPQNVAPEPALAASPTLNVGGGVAALGGVMGAVQAAGDSAGVVQQSVAALRQLADTLMGPLAPYWLPALLVAAGVIVVYRRIKQRRDGVA